MQKLQKKSFLKSSTGVDDVMRKLKMVGSFLSKVDNLNKVGGLTPKKEYLEYTR